MFGAIIGRLFKLRRPDPDLLRLGCLLISYVILAELGQSYGQTCLDHSPSKVDPIDRANSNGPSILIGVYLPATYGATRNQIGQNSFSLLTAAPTLTVADTLLF
jgi:hypothetical protein